jgi:hypothetical protein
MMSQGGMRWLARLGGFCARHARVVVIAWAVAFALASVGAHRLPALLFSGSGDIPGSPSLRIDHLLRTEFAKSHAQLLVLALHSASLDREPEAATTLFRALEARLKENPLVAEVMVEEKVQDKRMLPVPGTGHIALISLKAADVREAEQAIPLLRTAVEPLLRAAKGRTIPTWSGPLRDARRSPMISINSTPRTRRRQSCARCL